VADTHRINFEPVDIEMEVGEQENILDAAFRQGIHLMHGCREGRCSACKSYVLDGDIQMENYSTFACNDAEVEEGFVLLCRSHAFSDCTIELLNFDEDELLSGIAIQDVRTRVVAIEPMTKDIVSLRLRPVEPATYEFKSGQYSDLQIPGTEEHRSFSMATTQSMETTTTCPCWAFGAGCSPTVSASAPSRREQTTALMRARRGSCRSRGRGDIRRRRTSCRSSRGA